MRVHVVFSRTANLRSLTRALQHVGADVIMARDGRELKGAERIVLPGVGAFGQAKKFLDSRDLSSAIQGCASQGARLLGICLGMQLLGSTSEEFGLHDGLGLLHGKTVPLNGPGLESMRVPNVGWIEVSTNKEGGLIGELIDSGSPYYFTHSFQMVTENQADGRATIQVGSRKIIAALEKGNVVGVQFHPEKSGEAGLSLLRRFSKLR